MPVLHQKINAVFFQRDGIRITFWHALDDIHIRNIKLVSTGCALIGANLALDNHA
jgi:hypothetical protein